MAQDILQSLGQANNPNFNPDEYARLQHAKLMGDALLQQGLTDTPQGQMISGHYVPPAITQQIAKLLNMYVGNNTSTKASAGLMKTDMSNQRGLLQAADMLPGGQAQGAQTGADPQALASLLTQNPSQWQAGARIGQDGSPLGMAQGQPQTAPMQPVQQPTQAPGGAPAQSPFSFGPAIKAMVLQGMSPELAKAYVAQIAPAPTNEQINSRDQLIGGDVRSNLHTQNMTPEQKLLEARQQVQDGSPQAQILDAAIAKANYIAPAEVKQGNLVIDPIRHQPIAYNPNVDKGMSPTFNTTNGITTPTGAQVLSGYPQGMAQITGAEQAAKSSNSIINATAPGGAVVPVNAGLAAAAGNNKMGLSNGSPAGFPSGYAGGTRQSGDAMRAQVLNQELAQATQSGNTQNAALIRREMQVNNIPETGQTPDIGQSQTAHAMTTTGVNMYQGAVKEAQNTPQFRQALDEMYQLANTGKFGPGTGTIARIKAMLSNSGIDMSGAQTDQDVMRKMGAFISSSQLGAGGTTGTDAQLANILNGLPHGEMTNAAMKQVIPMLVGQLNVKEARANLANAYQQAHPNDLSGLPGAIQQFNKLADPGTVSLGMDMAKATANGTQAQHAQMLQQQFGNQLPKYIQRVQALHQLGAF